MGVFDTKKDRKNLIIIIPKYFLLAHSQQEVTLNVVPSALGKNKTYLTIVYYTVVVLFTFLPLILLATFNCFLVAAVHNSTKLRRGMTQSRKVSAHSFGCVRVCIYVYGNRG